MYTEQHLQYALGESRAKWEQNLSATDVRKARERLLDAREKLESVQAGERSIYGIQELQDAVLDAQRHYQDVHARAGHLEYVEAAQADERAREQQRQAEQGAFAAEQESEAKKQYRARYMAAGGTPAQFDRAWPALWQQELVRRTQRPTDTMQQKMLATGKYSA